MREIKFRAWDRNMKKIIYPSMGMANNLESWEILKLFDIIMQFTGLLANGTEIYEGDIMRFWDADLRRVRYEKVYFEDGAFWVNGREGQKDWGEKVGNIYENPELLEEK